MNIGAVVVAAGRSSRMGRFKPLLPLGPRTVAEHTLHRLRQSGVEHIAVVTGREEQKLRAVLDAPDVTFLHNGEYETTDMFHSAKLGLSHMAQRCDSLIFTPVDVPLFSPHTVRALLNTNAQAAVPVTSGKKGHPLLLSASLAAKLTENDGEGGLKGALTRLGITPVQVAVNDPGILLDADTPEEFAKLEEYYRSRWYPSDGEIEEMLNEMGTPTRVREHSEAVARAAHELALQITPPPDFDMLRAAALLHDIAKAQDHDHPAAGGEFLARRGYITLADMVSRHHDLGGSPSVETQLLYLADKLVGGSRRVPLEERFAVSLQKCKTPDALQHWERRRVDALRIVHRYNLDITNGENT